MFNKDKLNFENIINKNWYLVLCLVTVSVILSFFINLNISSPYSKRYRIGDFADRNIKAPQTIQVEDIEATELARNGAENSVQAVFDYDPNTINKIQNKIHLAFITLRKDSNVVGSKEIFEKHLDIKLSDKSYQTILKNNFSWRIERLVIFILNFIPNKFIVSSMDDLVNENKSDVLVNTLNPELKENIKRISLMYEADNFVLVKEVKDLLKSKLQEIKNKLTKSEFLMLNEVIDVLAISNFTSNKEKTLELKKQARERTRKVIIQVKRGEIIVRDGEPIEKEHLLILGELSKAKTEYRTLINFIVNFLIILLSLYAIFMYAKKEKKIVFLRHKDILVVSLFFIFNALSLKTWYFVSNLLVENFTNVQADVLLLFFPVIAFPLLVRLVLGAEFASLLHITFVIVAGFISDWSFNFSMYYLFSGFIALIFVRQIEERTSILKIGFYCAIFQLIFASSMALGDINSIGFSWNNVLYTMVGAFLSGILSALVVESFLPIIEILFNYTSNLRLLEFANTNHPLLRDLLMRAPGTFNHSMIVGQLASAGANAIGANTLLARVGSYFHDIGKIGKANYFIENQQAGNNPHDRLNTTMSIRILVSHVKDGVRHAKEYKLGKLITDIIIQHHGTSLMRFFYSRAIEQEAGPNELDYRYPGPKPSSKESVLVMIADAVEAAVRSIEDPTPTKIKNMVEKIINNLFSDGQFDESSITLKMLKEINQVYTKILISLYHIRIDYPDLTDKEKKEWK